MQPRQRLVLWNKAKPMLHCVYRIEVIIISDAVYTGCCTVRQISDRKLLPRSVYDMLTQISNDFQWLLYRVQCRQTIAVAARRVRCRHSVTHLLRRNKATSASDRRTSAPCSLQRWKADPIFTRVLLLALSFRRRFSLFFFYPPFNFFLSLSFCRSARLMSVLCTERSLLHIMSRHAPYCWLATSLFWYSAPTQFSKAFLKNDERWKNGLNAFVHVSLCLKSRSQKALEKQYLFRGLVRSVHFFF